MVRITEELLRKRAEHNDGILESLAEITLHQFEIEKIENLHLYCKRNNVIAKIENLSKLRQLKYLNLAINNITKIEGLEGCESLEKLDLTVNFICDITTVESLVGNYNLRTLYLTGNSCTSIPGYRKYVIATLPQLTSLDGTDITKVERIEARQNFDTIKKDLIEYISKMGNAEEQAKLSREQRIQAYKEIQERKQAGETQTQANESKNKSAAQLKFKEDGTVLQRNEGNYKFQFSETKTQVILKVQVGKYLDTSLIDIDVQPKYVKLLIKGKLLALNLPKPVHPDKTSAQRAKVNGELMLTFAKVYPDDEDTELNKFITVSSLQKESPKSFDDAPAVDIHNIIKCTQEKVTANEDEVPPLEDAC